MGHLYNLVYHVPEGLIVRTSGVLRCDSGTASVVWVVGYKVTAVEVRRQDEGHLHDQLYHSFCLRLNLQHDNPELTCTSLRSPTYWSIWCPVYIT
jgi:hypothetical protein